MTIKRTLKLVLALLILMVAFYLFFQVYNVANPSYKTTVALEYTVSDSIRCRGIAVRDEMTMSYGGDAAINFLIDNGEKVAKGSNIAELYSSAEGARNSLIESALLDEADIYKNFSPSSSGNINSLSAQLYKHLRGVSAAVSTGDYEELSEAKSEMSDKLAAFLSTSGKDLDFGSVQAELTAKSESFSSGAQPARYLTAEASGYFFNSVDGYEDVINSELLYSFSAEQLISLIETANATTKSGMCKVIDGYFWRFAAVVDGEYAERFRVGSTLSLDFRYASVASLDMVVEEVIPTADGKKAVVVFSCDYLNGDIAALRLEEVEISFRNYTGIRVDRSALKMDNGEFGVYVKYGTSVVFKKVDVIFETDDYIISRNDTTNTETVKLYDEIITEGKELYVGKEL